MVLVTWGRIEWDKWQNNLIIAFSYVLGWTHSFSVDIVKILISREEFLNIFTSP
jgi:hypothetical protein